MTRYFVSFVVTRYFILYQIPVRGWGCEFCARLNLPLKRLCEACGQPRPEDYDVPADYELTAEEMDIRAQEEEDDMLLRQVNLCAHIVNHGVL